MGPVDFVVSAAQAHTRYSDQFEKTIMVSIVGSFSQLLLALHRDTDEITIATWTSGERHLAFAQPVSLPEYTDMREQGSPFQCTG